MCTELDERYWLNNSLRLNKRSGVNNLLFPVKLGPFGVLVQGRVSAAIRLPKDRFLS